MAGPGIIRKIHSRARDYTVREKTMFLFHLCGQASELLDWIKLLMAEDIPPEVLRMKNSKNIVPPLYGALLKNEQDVHLFEKLAFLNRQEER